ncbi:MAG: DNA-directed RNA polymerase subunit alpha C-terminal domain-containing protein [Phycisphaerae bacterium]
MESAVQDSIAEIIAKETWSAEDHAALLKELFQTADAPRRMRQILADLETANPDAKGGAALKIGIARYMVSRPNEALAALAEATDNKDRRWFGALCYKALGQYAKAAEELERAKDRGADRTMIDAELVEVHALSGDLEHARKELDKLRGKIGDKAEVFYLDGLVNELAGFKDKAAQAYEKAREIDPSHAGATFRLAYFCDLHGDEEQAIELYKECLAHPPVHVSALMNMAVLYDDAGKYDKAMKCLQSVLAANPNHLRARLFLKDAQASQTMYYDEEQAKRTARRNAVLDIPVTDFELSVRARNCLKKMNIRTLGDLIKTTEADLLAYKNFGETSLKEIKDMLTAKGLHLGQAIEEGGQTAPGAPGPAKPAAAPPAPPAAPAASASVLAKPVEGMEFSIRSRRALDSLGVKTLGDLAARTEDELLACKNFGQTSLNEIRQRLAEYGLTLKEPG